MYVVNDYDYVSKHKLQNWVDPKTYLKQNIWDYSWIKNYEMLSYNILYFVKQIIEIQYFDMRRDIK